MAEADRVERGNERLGVLREQGGELGQLTAHLEDVIAVVEADAHDRRDGLFAEAVSRGELDATVDFPTLSETIFDVWYYAMLRHYGRPISAAEVGASVERTMRLLLDHMRP